MIQGSNYIPLFNYACEKLLYVIHCKEQITTFTLYFDTDEQGYICTYENTVLWQGRTLTFSRFG